MASNQDYLKAKRRVWEIQSQCYHGDKAIWTEEIVEKVVEKLSKEKLSNGKPALKRWAWCNHNEDKVREENIEQLRLTDPLKEYHIGDPRPAHIHLALEFENAVYNTHLAKITGLDIHYIRKPEARYLSFLAICTYLSHCKQTEQDKGKVLYTADRIHCNFNYAEAVDQYLAKTRNLAQRNNPRRLADTYINRIESGDLDLESAKREIKDGPAGYAFFLRYEKELRAARTEYIKRHYEMKTRASYFIWGDSGTGKSTMSKYLARALFPKLEDYECFYTVGATGVRFDDYEYQPVIIWEDVRGEDLCDEYGSEGVLNLMELSPKKRAYNIKFGKVTLTHQVNIFTTTQTFEEFAAALMAKENKDDESRIEQAYRRVPMKIEVKANEILVYGNDKIFRGRDKSKFNVYYRIDNTNISQLNRLYGGEALDEAFATITEPMAMLHKKFMEQMAAAEKITDKEYAPKIISVVGFTEDGVDPAYEQYIAFCKDMLEHFRFKEDGSLGPYKAEADWKLGDELDGEFEGLRCPLEFDQWVEANRPKSYEDFAPGKPVYAKDASHAQDHARITHDYQSQQRILLHADAIMAYFDAQDEGENPDIPEGVFEEDLQDRSFTIGLINGEESNPLDYSAVLEYMERLSQETDTLMEQTDKQGLWKWIQMLLPDNSDQRIFLDPDAYDCLRECWGKVREACITAKLATNALSWYRLYQELNSIDAINSE